MKIEAKVFTKSKENRIIFDKETGFYKVKVSLVPEKGKANKRVIELLSSYFKVSKNKVRIVSGGKNSNKIINIEC